MNLIHKCSRIKTVYLNYKVIDRNDTGYNNNNNNNTQLQARSQPQNSKGAPASSEGAHNLHPKKVVTKSPSQPITARGSGGAL